MAFIFKLVLEDGTPADPPALHTAAPKWDTGDTISVSADTSLRVIGIRQGKKGRRRTRASGRTRGVCVVLALPMSQYLSR
jgi:hypothetical protein